MTITSTTLELIRSALNWRADNYSNSFRHKKRQPEAAR